MVYRAAAGALRGICRVYRDGTGIQKPGGGGTAPEPESAEDEAEETAAGAEGTAAEAAAEAAGAGWEAAQEALRAGLESAHIHLAGAAEKQQSKAKKRVAEYLKRFSGRGKREE